VKEATMKIATLASIGAAAALLAACGGGGGDDAAVAAPLPSASEQIPAAASESAQGMAAYLLALAADTPDDEEALDVARWTPPQSDADEPATLP
jgi:hypothetical protein